MKRIKCQKGAAVVEFALIVPLLIVIVFGIIEFSLLFFDKQVITNASREGARYGILWGSSSPDVAEGLARFHNSEITAKVDEYAASHLVTFGASITPVTTITRTGDTSGNALTVTVTYNYDFLLLPNFIPGLPAVKTLTGVTVMRLE